MNDNHNPIDAELIDHWMAVRQHAIEVCIISERHLLDWGVLKESERRVVSREERRDGPE